MTATTADFRCADCLAGRGKCRKQYRRGELTCHDCGLLYGGPGWVDAVVPASDWQLITPTNGTGGILCITCMARRFDAAGCRDVPLLIGSKLFSHNSEYWYQRGFEHGQQAATTTEKEPT